MSFFKSVLSTVSSLAAKANLDNLIEEDDRKAAEAAATAKTEAGKGKTASLPPLGPEYAHLNFTYITENIIGTC